MKQCPWIMYLRKSRADGDDTVEEVLARHETALQEYAISKLGHPIPEDLIYREVVSGETIQDRPQMRRVLEQLQTGLWAGVLCIDPQRLSRGDLMDCGTIIRILQYSNTAVVTPPKTYDLTDKFDRKFLEMELMRGADYLEYTKEILARGRLASVKAGYFVGSRAPYGYDKVRDGKRYTLAPNKDADTVRLIYHLFVEEGLNTAGIVRRLEQTHASPDRDWSALSIRDLLQNPVYTGKIRWNWKQTVKTLRDGQIVRHRPRNYDECLIVEGRHPAIISQELFDAAQSHFGHNPKKRGRYELRNPFASLLYCAACGRAMTLRTYTYAGTKEMRSPPRMVCEGQTKCHTKSVTYQAMEEAVVEGLRRHIGDLEYQLSADRSGAIRLQQSLATKAQKELANIEAQQARLYDLLETGVYDKATFLARNAALSVRRSEAEQALQAAQTAAGQLDVYKKSLCCLQDAVGALLDPEVTPARKNLLLRRIVERIDYTCTAPPRVKNAPFSLDIRLRENLFSVH